MRFCAIEHALPSKKVTNAEVIEKILSKSKQFLSETVLDQLKKTFEELFAKSISSIRYHRANGEKAMQFGIEAGQKALKAANMSANDIDLLIYVGVGRGFVEPATANVFQKSLMLKNATCFDILDACASWLRAVHVGHSFLKTKMYKNIMILNCEFNTREYTNYEFKSLAEIEFNFPSFTIGEAATATILSISENNEDDEYYADFKTWGELHTLCKIPLPNLAEYSDHELRDKDEIAPLTFFSYGEKLFRAAFVKLCRHYNNNSIISQFKPEIIFTHAASDAMSDRVLKKCNLDPAIAYNTHKRFGNTVSASVPLAMSYALKEGLLKHGAPVLIGFGSAGLTTAWAKFIFMM